MLVQRTRKLSQRVSGVSEGGNNYHLTQLQGHSGGLTAEVGEVIFVAFANLFVHHAHANV